jgi:8-oxo-dGTP pyrophosphatase MutT (NUDIX family)
MPDSVTLDATVGLPVIESSGGLVYNNDHHILMMFKRRKWDLPKGRVENGASYEETALREVSEETGLIMDRMKITGKLVPTWHTTTHGGSKYLKKTHWYLIEYNGDDDDTNPQVEEGIIECRWVHLPDLRHYQDTLRPRIQYVIDFWHQNLAYVPRR